MDWKASLDRYLTSPPEDYYSQWFEQVVESFTDDFYVQNEYWIEESKQADLWLQQLYDRSPADAAKIIERAFNIYIK